MSAPPGRRRPPLRRPASGALAAPVTAIGTARARRYRLTVPLRKLRLSRLNSFTRCYLARSLAAAQSEQAGSGGPAVAASRQARDAGAMDGAPMNSALAARLAEICGADDGISDPQQLRTYECDGLTSPGAAPAWSCCPGRPSRWRRSSGPAPSATFRSSPGQRHRPYKQRRAAAGRRRPDRHVHHAVRYRDRPGEPPGDRGAGVS